MDPNVLIAIISGVGALLVAVLGWMGQKKGTLAQAEQNFRDTILGENKSLRTKIKVLETENQELRVRIIKMEAALVKAGLVLDDDELS